MWWLKPQNCISVRRMLEETQAPRCQGCSSSTYIFQGLRLAWTGVIGMQSMPNGHHKWIIVYRDHLTKYCILRPLFTKRAAEVAYQLIDIFLLFGAPQILHSDNGSEFTVAVISELKLLWPDLLMVHGNPRHPQSQGSVERLRYCDVKDMLIAYRALLTIFANACVMEEVTSQ